jgi:dienelactone hydrolase
MVTGSDIGSLYSFLRRQVEHGTGRMAFLRPEYRDVEAWGRETRAKVLGLLHYAPPPVGPSPKLLAREERDGYTLERLEFSTTPDIRVPAFFLIPHHASPPVPALVALHDHGGFYYIGKEKLVEGPGEHAAVRDFKAAYYAGRSVASDLARQGYAVVVIDAFYFGERRLILDDDPPDWVERRPGVTEELIRKMNGRAGEMEALTARSVYAAGITWEGIWAWDDIRTVDFLLTRKEVDPQRIGCLGLSVGAYRTLHLMALDPRVKAGVAVCWLSEFGPLIKNRIKNTVGMSKIIPGLYPLLDLPDLAALAMPRALMTISGARDGLFTSESMKGAIQTLERTYAKAGIPERYKGDLDDTPHEFNAGMQQRARAWLDRWLRAQ